MGLYNPYLRLENSNAPGVFIAIHNCDGGVQFACIDLVDENQHRLMLWAIEEGKRQKAREILAALGGEVMARSQATPASSQIIALEGMVQRLEQQVAAQQARIAELREALEQVGCLMLCGKKDQLPGRCDNAAKVVKKALTKSDNLSTLEAAKAEAKREALMEAADYVFDLDVGTSLFAIQTQLRRMAGEVK